MLELRLITMLLGCIWALCDIVVSSDELILRVGDSALLGCVFQKTVKRQVTKVNWIFSAGEHTQDEIVLFYFANLSVPLGQFIDRVQLVGKITDNDGSILLQDVREADQGTYTCEIQVHEENYILKKTTMLRVVQDKPTTLKPTKAARIDVLNSSQHVIIVGIVCLTIILLAVLGATMIGRQHYHRPENGMENASKPTPQGEGHIYSTILAKSVTEEEESSRESEPTYMTMQPVWPSQRAEQNKSSEILPETERTLGGLKFAIRPLAKEDNIL